MTRNIAAQLGLLAFALAIVVGLYAGNSPATILLRGLAVLLAGAVLGQLAGSVVRTVLRDHLLRRKVALDAAHLQELARARAAAAARAEA